MPRTSDEAQRTTDVFYRDGVDGVQAVLFAAWGTVRAPGALYLLPWPLRTKNISVRMRHMCAVRCYAIA